MSLLIRIADLNDPRLDPYRQLKDRDLARSGERFIAEGEQVVRRLVDSQLKVDSVLLAEKRVRKMVGVIPPDVQTFVLPDSEIAQILGFAFHSGIMACGIRPPNIALASLLDSLPTRATLMFLPDINNTENLGTLLRIAAAFGVNGLLLGPRCCDPFYRQAVRVSMGAVFSLMIARIQNTLDALATLESSGFDTIATVLNDSAERLSEISRSDKAVLLFGNESAGLDPQVAAACNRRITIAMDLQTDSLNVAVAAGIVMHHFTRTLQPDCQ